MRECCPECDMPLAKNGGCYYPECCAPQKPTNTPAATVEAVIALIKDHLRGEPGEEYTDRGMEDAFFRWPTIEHALRASLTTQAGEPEPEPMSTEHLPRYTGED